MIFFPIKRAKFKFSAQKSLRGQGSLFEKLAFYNFFFLWFFPLPIKSAKFSAQVVGRAGRVPPLVEEIAFYNVFFLAFFQMIFSGCLPVQKWFDCCRNVDVSHPEHAE